MNVGVNRAITTKLENADMKKLDRLMKKLIKHSSRSGKIGALCEITAFSLAQSVGQGELGPRHCF
jgi:hypothetical protein